jgi:hypothetical protein
MLCLDHPLRVNEETGRNAAHPVEPGHVAALVQQNGEAEALFLYEGADDLGLLPNVYGQYRDADLIVLIIDLLENGPFSSAVGSPGCPEIDDHRAAPETTNGHDSPVQIAQLEVRSGHPRDGSGGRHLGSNPHRPTSRQESGNGH